MIMEVYREATRKELLERIAELEKVNEELQADNCDLINRINDMKKNHNSIPVKKIEEKIKDINEKLIFATMQANIKDMEKYAYQKIGFAELIEENTESEK